MNSLLSTGASREHIEVFLAADPVGAGSMRDQIAADMTNQLMGALGQLPQQTAGNVKRLRERGTWISFGERPRE